MQQLTENINTKTDMDPLDSIISLISLRVRDFFMSIPEEQCRALETGCSDENTKLALGRITAELFHIIMSDVMPVNKHCEGGVDPGESVNSGKTILQGIEEKWKHNACCPDSCTWQLNQEAPQSAGLESVSEVAQGPKSGPVADPSGDVTLEPLLLEQKLLVKELVNAVIVRASREAKVLPSQEIQQRLFIALWAQIKEKTLNIKRNRIKSLEKAIFKDISKLLGIPPDFVIVLLLYFQEEVIAIFKDHLFRKKRNLLTRLFAWCRKTQDNGDQTPETKKTPLEFEDNIFPLPDEKSQSGVSSRSHDADIKERVSTLIHDVLSHAAKTSHYKPSVKLHKRLFDNVVSDDRIKDLYIDKKKLKGLDEAIYQELRNKTFCEDKHLIMLLNEKDPVLQNLTIQIIKKYLIESMENPALSAAEEVQKYRSSLEICIEGLVKHLVEKADSPCSSEKVDAITERLFSKVWPRIKRIQIPAEYVPFLPNMVYKSLIEKWKDPDVILTFMSLDHRYIDELIIKVFKEHAVTILESQRFIRSFFSFEV